VKISNILENQKTGKVVVNVHLYFKETNFI